MPTSPVETSDTVSKTIKVLYRTHGLTFREIAALPAYAPIPFSTIADIYHGEKVPNKWRYKFDMPKIIKVRSDMVRRTPPAGTGRKRAPRVEIALSDLDCAVDRLNKKTGKKWSYE